MVKKKKKWTHKQVVKKGGEATLEIHGVTHFQKMAQTRWENERKRQLKARREAKRQEREAKAAL